VGAHGVDERRRALRVDDDDRLLTGRGLDEQLQERRFPAASAAERGTVAGQLAQAQMHLADGGLVADADAIAVMGDAAASTPASYPPRSASSRSERRTVHRPGGHGHCRIHQATDQQYG
jgi:hypothetical protein